jgi:D-amino-acid oxidase
MRQHEASPIAVIGAGVVGLSTAVRLLERGLAVTIHAEHRSPRIASAVAPAMFTPFPGLDVARSRRWAHTSLEALRALEHREGPTAGVRFGPFREYCYRQPGPRPFADLSSQRAVPVMPQGFAAVLDSDRPHIDTNRHLAWLESRFVLLGGRMVEEQLTSIDMLFERGHAIVVNCAGVGARTLARDPLVRAMRGIVVHMRRTLGLVRSLHDDAPYNIVAYVFIYDDHLVLGSTYEADVWDEVIEEEEVQAIVERCRRLACIDGCPNWRDLGAEIIDRRVGLRPIRGEAGISEDIRLEIEHAGAGRTIVHNYGHGRSGVSLAWGTAEEAADMALAVINGTVRSV